MHSSTGTGPRSANPLPAQEGELTERVVPLRTSWEWGGAEDLWPGILFDIESLAIALKMNPVGRIGEKGDRNFDHSGLSGAPPIWVCKGADSRRWEVGSGMITKKKIPALCKGCFCLLSLSGGSLYVLAREKIRERMSTKDSTPALRPKLLDRMSRGCKKSFTCWGRGFAREQALSLWGATRSCRSSLILCKRPFSGTGGAEDLSARAFHLLSGRSLVASIGNWAFSAAVEKLSKWRCSLQERDRRVSLGIQRRLALPPPPLSSADVEKDELGGSMDTRKARQEGSFDLASLSHLSRPPGGNRFSRLGSSWDEGGRRIEGALVAGENGKPSPISSGQKGD
ncbi:hypothetical protein BDK51DRAFT_33113 [Blyttiomyces helicus]|uniref:Uncharacterized protein n=1 Tax=Blyttiomyces helicus TaxID=388810 RepID=A0A4P9W1X6_9FUNG|nr:hypothetical protein BDK51DRAFT_33113 [Blyttiomyces helicus]|eukprot:RKO85365.1 hypothetical protein BDK51DRAFT_33113 [Blyttiomyces helicus]